MSLANKFDEYCKNHKDTCGDDCDVGKCMREFCYQQGYDDAMELLSGTSVAYSFLNDEKHKAYLQGREDGYNQAFEDLMLVCKNINKKIGLIILKAVSDDE